MDYYSNQISKLIDELSRLPGIGAKSASRLAFHLIHMPKEEVKRLADTMVEARENVRYCKECCTLTDQELCPICSNLNRDHKDNYGCREYKRPGSLRKDRKIQRRLPCTSRRNLPDAWHRPGDIKLKELIRRLEGDVEEVIIATNSSLEGETTAMYISKLIKPTGVKVSRIASGVPVGGDLEVY